MKEIQILSFLAFHKEDSEIGGCFQYCVLPSAFSYLINF